MRPIRAAASRTRLPGTSGRRIRPCAVARIRPAGGTGVRPPCLHPRPRPRLSLSPSRRLHPLPCAGPRGTSGSGLTGLPRLSGLPGRCFPRRLLSLSAAPGSVPVHSSASPPLATIPISTMLGTPQRTARQAVGGALSLHPFSATRSAQRRPPTIGSCAKRASRPGDRVPGRATGSLVPPFHLLLHLWCAGYTTHRRPPLWRTGRDAMCHKRSPSNTQKGGKGAVEYDSDHDFRRVRFRGAGPRSGDPARADGSAAPHTRPGPPRR